MVKCYIPKNPDLGSLILRVTLGLLFIYGGVGKLFINGVEGFAGAFELNIILAWLVALGELLGGIALLVGFMSRHASIGLIIIMFGAIFLAHNPFSNSGELMNALIRLALIGGLAQILFSGSGKTAMQKD